MSKIKKIGIGIGLAIASFFIIIVVIAAIQTVQQAPEISTAVQNALEQQQANKITGISDFTIIKQGSFYQASLSLVDANSAEMTSNAHVTIVILNGGTKIYTKAFDIKASDFGKYKYKLTGAEFTGYVWQIDAQELPHGDYDILKALIQVTLPNGKSFNADTSVL